MATSGIDESQLVVPKGSLVVVTGANGVIASHVVDQLIKAGYRARGTVRSKARCAWMIDHFDSKYGPGKFELVEVPEMAVDDAFDEAVKGATGFIHMATPVGTGADPNAVIPMVIKGTIAALEAAAKEPGLKRVVLTSSSGACSAPKPNQEFTIDTNTWNEESVAAAWAPPPYEGASRVSEVYFASKTQGEQAAWEWMKSHSPSNFTLNAVLPNANFGPVISAAHQGYGTTLGWIRALWTNFDGLDEQQRAGLLAQPPQHYVNIVDDALLHIAALVYSDVQDERLMAFAYPYNWNDLLAGLRKLSSPERILMDDMAELGRDVSRVTNERAEELLRRISGHGWTGLEETIQQAVSGYV